MKTFFCTPICPNPPTWHCHFLLAILNQFRIYPNLNPLALMNLFHKYGTRPNEIRRAKREFFFRMSLVLAALLFFAGMLVITRFSPRLDNASRQNIAEPRNAGDTLTNPELNQLREQVADLRAEFASQQADGIEDVQQLEILEQAIALQRRVIRLRGSEIAPKRDLDSLDSLLTLYDEEMGQFLIAQSNQLEQRAAEAAQQNEFTKAIELYEKARNLQEEINEQYSRSSARSASRLHRLESRILNLRTEPMAREADQLRDKAIQLADDGEFTAAIDAMEAALEQQQSLNEDYRQSRFASLGRLKTFRDTWTDIQVAEDASRVSRLIEEARIAMDVEDADRALRTIEEAEVLQNRIRSRFPNSDAADSSIMQTIQQLHDTASSLPAYLRIRDLRTQTRQLLRERAFDNFPRIVSEWFRAVDTFQTAFPQSDFVDSINPQEVRFLHANRDEIPLLSNRVYEKLLPVPGHRERFLFSTEVSQNLFTQIMEDNPSQNRGPLLPVDSVTWTEAREFNRKLGWILARPVDLPNRLLFTNAMGTVSESELTDTAWSSANANRQTQPVGSSNHNDFGFFDLLGNVSEWLGSASGETPERVVAIGGSARDSLLRLLTIPEEAREPTERNRFVGFRFMVYMDN